MKKISFFRKYAFILALAVSAVWILPETLFAQGAVVGFAPWDRNNSKK